MTKHAFEKLLEPGRISTVKTKNCMVKSGAAARYWGIDDAQVSARIKHYYEAFARGGIGLLIVEGPIIEPSEAHMSGNYRLDDDKYIAGIAELTTLIHNHDCPAFVQLNHTANWQKTMPWNKPPAELTEPPRAASPVCVKSVMDNNNEMPREITVEEIQEIIDKIGTLAVRLEKAGFDGIEINAASTHLFHSFLSPFWNKRHDEYGCDSLENRTRFLVKTIREIKKRLGEDYPVSVIINALELGTIIGVENRDCLTLEDARRIAHILQAAGADAIQTRSQWLGLHDASFLTDHFYYPEPAVPHALFPDSYYAGRRGAGANMLLSAAIKKEVDIPVMTVGRLDPKLGEKILRDGKADFICFNRRLIADPELPNKVSAGRLDDIMPCTSCTTCKTMGGYRRCRINGATGTDEAYTITSAKDAKELEKEPDKYVVAVPPQGQVPALAGYTLDPNSPFADIRVRRAMSYAINVSEYNAGFGRGYWMEQNQWAVPGTWGYNEDVVGYPYDPEKAKELLAEAGYPDGFDTTLSFFNTGQAIVDENVALQGYLQAVGIRATLNPLQRPAFSEIASLSSGWEGIVRQQGFSSPDPLIKYANVIAGNEFTGTFLNDEIKDLYNHAITAPDFENKKQLTHELMAMVVDKYCIATYLSVNSTPVVRSTVVRDSGYGKSPYSYISPFTWLDE